MMRYRWVGVALWLSGCAAGVARVPAPVEVARRAPAPVGVAFSSDLPDPYPVLTGPIETYRYLRVNDRMKTLLDAYALAKSGPSANTPIQVLAHLEKVVAGYKTLGRLPRPRTRLALGPTTIASDALPSYARDDGELGDSKPYQITKTVEVTLVAEVQREGRSLGKKSLVAKRVEVVEREDIDPWTYDYGPLVDDALREAVRLLDGFVDETVGGGSGR